MQQVQFTQERVEGSFTLHSQANLIEESIEALNEGIVNKSANTALLMDKKEDRLGV